MQDFKSVEVRGIKVLTTKQIAEAYEVKNVQIGQNFANNRKKFVEGKHYISLTGDDLRAFKNQFEKIELVDSRASHLYLWTEKGALLHAKSLNTDKAWEVYDYLVDFYFRARSAETEKTENKNEVVPVKVQVAPLNEELPESLKYKSNVPEILDPVICFKILLHMTEEQGIRIRLLPLDGYGSILRGKRLGIGENFTLREIDYELAWNLAHTYLQSGYGDTERSSKMEEFNEQATKAAGMIIQLINSAITLKCK